MAVTSRPVALVLRTLGLGDLCTAVPALCALRRAFPDHRLMLAAPRWQAPLVRQTGVDALIALDELRPLLSLTGAVDLAVNLHGRGPQSTRVLLGTAPRRLITYSHPEVAETAGGPRWRRDEHEVDRWCRLLEESGIPTRRSDLRLPPPRGPRPLTRPHPVLVHPGAAAAGRRWPPGRFATVVAELTARGHHVVLTGTEGEVALCEHVRHLSRCDPQVLAGRTDLAQLAVLVHAASALICNDTGVAHLATAYGTPSVVLFGPTSPAEWGPPPSGPHRALWAGRTGDPHADTLDPGLEHLHVDDVLRAFDEVCGAAA